ncbi:LOW QUALITY PROTEIN: granulocyte colony-stimulating factor receptor [Falco naumanni]|uniref:LOW QUALITY PROTEIN: granulocyte colony-stimulating factor receptor n=1 Tax=Falco naumanni TaxID=148594 RepID=UPI001ADE5885|nr:LOW QUALITY PROTEIN: granulocyte colony-stimulating factor receptor [Falco naumanni]
MARRGAGTPFLLQLSLLLLLCPGGTLGCASVAAGSPVVPLGSAVTASCTIQSELCRGLEPGKVRITWMLDNEPVAGSQHRGPGGTEVSNLTLPQFNHTEAKLWCWVEWNGTKQRVGMAEIRAGYPPAKPFNLSCVLNLSDYGLTCQWEQGANSHLPTSIALKCAGSRTQVVTGCTPQGGHSHCTVPRQLLQLYRQMEIWVSATNALGTAESEHLCIDPMDVAKLDPPALQSIQSIPFQTDCVALAWEVARTNAHMDLQCELRYRAAEEPAWALVTGIVGRSGTTQCCGFLFGMQYHFQMRCRRSTARGYWSEWSPGRNYTTHEKAPTGKLDAWWSTRPAGAGGWLEVQLRWKAPQRRDANGQVLGYRVTLSPRRRGRDPPTICNTTHTQCNFSAPMGTRRVYLSAYNAAGESTATEVVLLERKGQPLAGLRAVPKGEHSLWVQWEAPPAPPHAYVLEWQRVSSEPGRCSACWQMERDGAATAALIQDGIEPFQRYDVSVYPLYKDAIGVPIHTAAYSKQKAPSYAPKLHLKSISKSSAELCWDPVPVEMQNGFITSYTIFWANSDAEVSSATVNPSLSSFIIHELKPSTLYKVHIMASTVAGSTNGTSLTLVTTVLDDTEIQFLFLTLGLIFVLFILLLICFQKNGRVKQQFWPSIPDPANSSLGKWVPAELQQEPLHIPGVREPGLATISTVTVLERAGGKQPTTWGKEPSTWGKEPSTWGKEPTTEPIGTFPAPPLPYVQQEGPRTPGPGSRQTVQYARVVGEGYKGQQQPPPRLYLRSSSTQPLLLDPSPSPKPYENLWFHGAAPQGCPGDGGCPEELSATFPLLQGLRIGGAEELHDCRAF